MNTASTSPAILPYLRILFFMVANQGQAGVLSLILLGDFLKSHFGFNLLFVQQSYSLAAAFHPQFLINF